MEGDLKKTKCDELSFYHAKIVKSIICEPPSVSMQSSCSLSILLKGEKGVLNQILLDSDLVGHVEQSG